MWKPVDTEFFVPLLPVSLVHVSGGGMELTRAALEALGCVVLAHRVGTPSDFLRVLGQGDQTPRYMVILGHGDENGLAFGEYGPKEIDVSILRDGSLPPEAMGAHVDLPGCTVISYSCGGGTDAMARAFLAGGAAAYIGCRTEVQTVALTLFLFHFLFGALHKKLSDADAWRQAVLAVDHPEVDQMRFWHGNSREEPFARH
jgi:hypothetical protein